MLNKKCLFGGLCLGNAVAIFTSISGDVIAQEPEGRNIIVHAYCQSQWYIHAHNIIEKTKQTISERNISQGQIKDNPWFIDWKYDKSIKEVIGKAIADCMTNMNEFQGKKAVELITFENTAPKDYEQKHWNAVMLYNYVNKMIRWGIKQNYADKEILKQKIMDFCFNELKNHYRQCLYSTEYSDINLTLLKKAQSDILEYVNVFKVDLAIFNYANETTKRQSIFEKAAKGHDKGQFLSTSINNVSSTTTSHYSSVKSFPCKYASETSEQSTDSVCSDGVCDNITRNVSLLVSFDRLKATIDKFNPLMDEIKAEVSSLRVLRDKIRKEGERHVFNC